MRNSIAMELFILDQTTPWNPAGRYIYLSERMIKMGVNVTPEMITSSTDIANEAIEVMLEAQPHK